MIVLMIGDVVGQAGCNYVRAKLPMLKQRYSVDITVVNAENSAEGNGVTAKSANHLLDSGADVLTLGNHALQRREIYDVLDQNPRVIRPANYHKNAPGNGVYIHDDPRRQLCVINLQGNAYMQPPLRSPFERADELLALVGTPNILVDFHAEATAEKLCMGYYLDGRVSAVVGTHTHVPTADAHVLPGGTGYITDVGMVGGYGSVLGVKKELAMQRTITGLPTRFENDPEDVRLSAVALDIDESCGRCRGIESLVML